MSFVQDDAKPLGTKETFGPILVEILEFSNQSSVRGDDDVNFSVLDGLHDVSSSSSRTVEELD